MTFPSYDRIEADPLFRPGSTYFQLTESRWLIIDRLIRESKPRTVLDIGFFPGLVGRRIKEFYPGIVIDGIGKLNGGSDFPGYGQIFEAEFDPFYGQVDLPRLAHGYDLIIANEIIEHIINPTYLLQFINASLSPNGLALMTTPNVSNFGAIGRLLRGKSNYETIQRSVIMLNNDWRAHVRLYAREELIELGRIAGLRCLHHEYYISKMIYFEKTRGINWYLRYLFSVFPWFREDQWIIYVK